MTAARDAVRRMIDLLGREHGLAPMRSTVASSAAEDWGEVGLYRGGRTKDEGGAFEPSPVR